MHLADAAGNPPEWHGGAACRHHDPDLFFPEGTAGPALRQVDQAKRVCRACPVRTPCLGFALRHGVAFGIWGGTTAEERRQGSARLGGPDLPASRHGEHHAGSQGDGDLGGSFRDGRSSSAGAPVRAACAGSWAAASRSPVFGLARHPPADESEQMMDSDAGRLPDEVLLAGLGAGDVDFTVTFVHRFQRVVFGVAVTITGDPGTAEDVAQQAFQRAWRDAGGYDSHGGSVRAWLTAIARDLAVDVIHACTSTSLALDDLSGLLTAMTDTPEQLTVAHEGAAVLRGTLAHLPATQARALAMAGIYGMTARQIADAEGIPLDTAKTRIRDGMQRLRDAKLPEDAGND